MIKIVGNISKMFGPLFKKLNPRERMVVMALGMVIVLSLYTNLIYKPQKSKINIYKSELLKLRTKRQALKTQMPDMKQERDLLDAEAQSLASLKRKLTQLEAGMPSQAKINMLLGELINLGNGLVLDFISIRPTAIKAEAGYSTLSIEMKLNSNFQDVVNYLHRLENMKQFLNATSIKMEKLKENVTTGANTTIVLSTYLGETSANAEDKDMIKEFQPMELAKDPFGANSALGKKNASLDLVLTGIIWKGPKPTAIINDQVVNVGDKVSGFLVKEIMKNSVILTKDDKRRTLVLEE